MTRRAVVFAYHNVGVRCLRVLAARGIQVELVVTHEDNAAENIWFGSVRATAQELGIPFVTPEDARGEDLYARIAALAPDFIFSFYYRHMIPMRLLGLATQGAFNMHGSLLPKYRGRVPINWAVLHGETETGATLHEMVEKPDAGYIVDQTVVPILPDDTAHEVFEKATVAAEQTLWRALPAMIAGCIPRHPNRLEDGSYFGGRKPEDGRIDWSGPAQQSTTSCAPWRRPIRAPSRTPAVNAISSRGPGWRDKPSRICPQGCTSWIMRCLACAAMGEPSPSTSSGASSPRRRPRPRS